MYFNQFKDDDMTKEAREARYTEHKTIKALPFLSKEQNNRVNTLSEMITRDNKYAFQQACYGVNHKNLHA